MVRQRKASLPEMLSQEIKSYFENLILTFPSKKDLATVKDEVIGKVEKLAMKINIMENRIVELENEFHKADKKIEIMEAQIALRDNSIEVLKKACDDQEQYGRRNCIRLNGLPFEKDKNVDVMATVRHCLKGMGVPEAEADIDRAHRIGKPRSNTRTGAVEQQIIVKFRSWNTRTKVYRARPREKQGAGKFTVCLDLTKRRQALLSLARNLISSNNRFSFAFTDVNCNLGLKLAYGAIKFFETEEQLRNLAS